MADLPFILAGPIIRRVTPRIVSVWIAFSRYTGVKLSIWDKEISTGPEILDENNVPEIFDETADPPLFSSNAETIRIGNNLHIAVVTKDLTPVENNPTFPSPLIPGQLYSYNLSFTAPPFKTSDLKSNHLLEDIAGDESEDREQPDNSKFLRPHLALGYKPDFLPTFVLPPQGIDKLNLAHGSCRKVHGFGKDCLAALDYVIKDAVTNNSVEKRPHQLYLTGDQIYADDMTFILLPYLTTLGNELIGIKETLKIKINGTEEDLEVSHEAVNNDIDFRVLSRQKTVQTYANLTSSDAHNHLLTFGEFAATYIVYWSNSSWPEDLFGERDELIDNFLNQDFIDDILVPDQNETGRAEKLILEKKNFKEEKKGEVADVIAFRDSLPYVRRVLANVPVFMIMDDHEVTDDWYVSKTWKNAVLTTAFGVNIIRNALMAYSLFQDWGNDPLSSDYQTGNKSLLLAKLQLLFPENALTGPTANIANEIDSLFGFDLPDETPPPVKWHYSVPCGETTVYVLDTRTRRTYETLKASPGLLSNSAMDDQIPISLQPQKVSIFVSPAPVLGLAVIEELLQPISVIWYPFKDDPEPWAFCAPVFEKILDRIQKFKRVILLSGDVHFGISVEMDYWKKGESNSSRIIQLVSSALKNQRFGNEQFLISAMMQKLLSSLFYPIERMGWNSNAELKVTNPAGKINPPKFRVRLRKEPVLLPTHGWPEGSVISRGSNLEEPPDWAWRLSIIKDNRPDGDSSNARPEKIQVKSIEPDIDLDNGDVSSSYDKVLARHVDIFKKSVARSVAFDCNVGLINFTLEDDEKIAVIHTFLYWLASDEADDEPDAYTVYTASLEPSADAQPSITEVLTPNPSV